MPAYLDTIIDEVGDGAKIKVIGVGGGGGNAINNMIKRGLTGVGFVVANTDNQALQHNLAQLKIQLGSSTTNGLGAGANPEVGRKSAEESENDIREVLRGSDMVFVTAGMGGGTGTGGAPTIAKISQELGALVVGIVTKPFQWEGKKRMNNADEGIRQLRESVDALIVIPNHRLLEIIDKNTSLTEAFNKVDEVLYNATRGIADIIGTHGLINVDFADVRTVMKGMGDALMGIGVAAGENRATVATQNALNSPLLDGISIAGAQGVLVNITGGKDLTMHEISEAVTIVESAAGSDANIIHGVVQKDEALDEIMVTVVATGFKKAEVKPAPHQFRQQHGNRNEIFEPQPDLSNGKGRPEIMGGIVPRPADNGYKPNFPPACPKGTTELKKYDKPAFERINDTSNVSYPQRRAEETALNMNPISSSRHSLSKSDIPDDDPRSQMYRQPAFLRKILD
ncbi:MAG: cell division protein FtsZ [Chloroflexota bacterium]